jgi:hypothetical protein
VEAAAYLYIGTSLRWGSKILGGSVGDTPYLET